MIAFLWAEDLNGVIGKDGQLPWHLPNDMKFFKRMTVDQIVVMGRKTFEGMGAKPLPNRINVVLTLDKTYSAEGAIILHSREEVMDYIKDASKNILIIGGAGVFESFLGDADLLYRTIIEESFDGDTYMIPINWEEWKKVDSVTGEVDEKNRYAHRFETYVRK